MSPEEEPAPVEVGPIKSPVTLAVDRLSLKSWVGVCMALLVMCLFGIYITKHEITAVAGFVFGGGLLFCGLLIDPAEFRALLALVKRSSP